MKWIRSPAWDCGWILSAPLLGLLMLLPLVISLPTRAITVALLCINFAHALAPIVLAWSHPGYRGVMLARPAKFVGAPILVIALGISAAVGTWLLYPTFQLQRMVLENLRIENLGVPIVLWANLYAGWNLYHAGAQNFGVLCLYRRRGFRGRQRAVVLIACVVATVFLSHEASRLFGYQIVGLFCLGLVSVNHWLTAIGLSAHVHAQSWHCSPWWFVAVVLAAGGLLMWAFQAALLGTFRSAVMALCLRAALGIWHFLQDRYLWQFSKPEVRNTIGVAMFAHA